MQEVQSILPNGSVVRNRYVVEELLGKGGFGAVYRVRDLRVKGNQFALKEMIDPKKQDRQRFTFEGEVLKRLDHPALPRVYHVFEDDQQLRVYLLMDYITGPNLEALRQLQPGKRFTLPHVMRLMAPLVEAVTYLHSQQPPIIHRDIKPANIIVPSRGEGTVLVDFGIAKEYDQDATTTAVRRLSPGYSAPEQYAQGTSPRSDVYAMAATFYTLLTGTVPADALSRMIHLGGQEADPLELVNRLVPDLPEHVVEAIHRAMAIDINERFTTIQALWQALQTHPLQPSSSEPIISLQEPYYPVPLPAPEKAPAAPTVSKYRQRQERPSKSRRLLLPFFAFIALGALLVGVVFGTDVISASRYFGFSASTSTTTVRQNDLATRIPKPTTTHPISTGTVPASPTPSGQSQPPSAPTSPVLKGQYSGTIHNASANIDGTMSLTRIHQTGTDISGFLTLANGLQGQASFTGTVSSGNILRFLVTPYTQYLPLLFQGQVKADGSLSGSYCSARNNQCDYSRGGFGTWKVSSIPV